MRPCWRGDHLTVGQPRRITTIRHCSESERWKESQYKRLCKRQSRDIWNFVRARCWSKSTWHAYGHSLMLSCFRKLEDLFPENNFRRLRRNQHVPSKESKLSQLIIGLEVLFEDKLPNVCIVDYSCGKYFMNINEQLCVLNNLRYLKQFSDHGWFTYRQLATVETEIHPNPGYTENILLTTNWIGATILRLTCFHLAHEISVKNVAGIQPPESLSCTWHYSTFLAGLHRRRNSREACVVDWLSRSPLQRRQTRSLEANPNFSNPMTVTSQNFLPLLLDHFHYCRMLLSALNTDKSRQSAQRPAAFVGLLPWQQTFVGNDLVARALSPGPRRATPFEKIEK